MEQFQHGDLLLTTVEDLTIEEVRAGGARLRAVNDRLTLLEGEQTGHAHQVQVAERLDKAQGTIEVWDFGGVRYVYVPPFIMGAVVHEEHGHRQLPPGLRRRSQVQEEDPFSAPNHLGARRTRAVYD